MWVATKGGYLVRYKVTTQENADYFDEGIEGSLTWDYEITDVNQPVAIQVPADCPAGLVNAPLLPDAANTTLSLPCLLLYDSATSLHDGTAFYQRCAHYLALWEFAWC